MTRDLPDELLSAYLDGEVTADERAAVEAHLANSEADRQLLAELRSLRSDMALLPPAAVAPDFAERVVRAAIAAKAANSQPVASPAQRARRNWLWKAAAAGATAACLFIAVSWWRPAPQPIANGPHTPVEQLIAALHSAVPGEGQAVVLRLRLPKDMQVERALAAALVTAGVGSKAADANTGAGELGAAYRAQLAQQIGSDAALANATVAAAEAIFVEAPLANLEKLLAALADSSSRPCELRPEARLAFAGPRRGSDSDSAIGEAPPSGVRGAADGAPFVQHLPASLFRLPKEAAPVTMEQVGASANGDKLLRVLILIEQVEAR